VDDEICRILARDRGEFLHGLWTEFTHPEDRNVELEYLQRLFDGAEVAYSAEKRWIRKDQSVAHTTISVSSVRSFDGSIIRFLVLMRDITARKAAGESKMTEQNERELRVQERTSQLAAANARLVRRIDEKERMEKQLRELYDAVSTELSAMRHLHEFATYVLSAGDIESILREMLKAVVKLQAADFGDIWLYDKESEGLDCVAQMCSPANHEMSLSSLCKPGSLLWQAAANGERDAIEDVLTDKRFVPYLDIAASEGFRSLNFAPLVTFTGGHVGVMSTYFRQPRRSSELERRQIELYTMHAAEAVERKRSEDTQRKLASVVENSFDFVGMASLDGHAQIVNLAGRQLVGLNSLSQVRRTRIPDYLTEDDRKHLLDKVLNAVTRDGKWLGEIHFRHFKTGAAIPMLQHIFLVKDEKSGRPVAIGTIAHDLSERKALRETQTQLAQVARINTLGELAGTIAHEISQPLAAIVANGTAGLSWLRRPRPEIDEACNVLDEIVRQGHRASDVITRTRNIIRGSPAGKAALDLRRLIREAISLTHDELRRHGVHVETKLDADVPSPIADGVQIQQVLLNLILNAIDAACTIPEDNRRLTVKLHRSDDNSAIVAVQDSGSGFKENSGERLFTPFYTTKPGGIGMGLAISRSIIEEHGGRIWATSNPAGGATFHFSLPLSGTA
jgi:PAS domain S-box-containing protein